MDTGQQSKAKGDMAGSEDGSRDNRDMGSSHKGCEHKAGRRLVEPLVSEVPLWQIVEGRMMGKWVFVGGQRDSCDCQGVWEPSSR